MDERLIRNMDSIEIDNTSIAKSSLSDNQVRTSSQFDHNFVKVYH